MSGPLNTMLPMRSSLEKPYVVPMHNALWTSQNKLNFQWLANGEKQLSSEFKWKRTLVSCAKTTETIKTSKSDGKLFLFCAWCVYIFVPCVKLSE